MAVQHRKLDEPQDNRETFLLHVTMTW